MHRRSPDQSEPKSFVAGNTASRQPWVSIGTWSQCGDVRRIGGEIAVNRGNRTKDQAKRLLRPKDVEQRYDLSEGYQAKLRSAGDCPEYIKIGSRIFYEEEAIERWLASKRRTSTSDIGVCSPQVPINASRKVLIDNGRSAAPHELNSE
jgi:predicted DNA-binding transcriptional regulator AlpA